MHPSEYKPYDDDGFGFGDYPKLPDVPVESRDPYYPYDMPEHKRNFGEPIHIYLPIWSEDRHGTAQPYRFAPSTMFYSFVGVMTVWFLLYFWGADKPMFRPVLIKRYPNDGSPAYTFEPAK